ncbi:MAG: hypothetical protein C0608_01940 [Deltaproteobacteria bacterium]|nr:MAG: hypothetical protein C0608_01940 [Deltaproteobacteria bacterium]
MDNEIREDRLALVAALVPDEVVEHYKLPDPLSFADQGRAQSGPYDFFDDGKSVRVKVWPRLDIPDPAFVLDLKVSYLGEVEIVWISINDIDAPRFDVDALGNLPIKPKSGRRNIEGELRAMKAGLAPNQVRRGLGYFTSALGKIDAFAKAISAPLISIFPMAYHNAILYERRGFHYRSGDELMVHIHEGFLEGGVYKKQLDGSSPFKMPALSESIRGRSWAIHNGILREMCYVPSMYRMVGEDHAQKLDTAPGIKW